MDPWGITFFVLFLVSTLSIVYSPFRNTSFQMFLSQSPFQTTHTHIQFPQGEIFNEKKADLSVVKKKPKSILPGPKKLPEQFRIAFHQNLYFLHIVALFPAVRVIHIPSVNRQMSFCSYVKLLIMKRPYNFIPTS